MTYEIFIQGAQKKYLQQPGNEAIQLINPVVTKNVNASDTFEFAITKDHPHFNDCVPGILRVNVIRSFMYKGTMLSEYFFVGTIVETSEDIYGQKRVRCAGLYELLKNAVIYPAKWQGSMDDLILQAMGTYNGQARMEDLIGIGTYQSYKTVSAPIEMQYTTVYDAFKKMTDQVGGYFVQTSSMIEYFADMKTAPEFMHDATFGNNLIERTRSEDMTEMITRIFPLGAKTGTQTGGVDDRVTIGPVNGGRDYIDRPAFIVNQYGVKAGVVTFDDISDPNELKAAGTAYLSMNGGLFTLSSVSAIDMSYLEPDTNRPWNLCDAVRVIMPDEAVSVMAVTKITANINAPQNDKVTVGRNATVPITQKIK